MLLIIINLSNHYYKLLVGNFLLDNGHRFCPIYVTKQTSIAFSQDVPLIFTLFINKRNVNQCFKGINLENNFRNFL